MASRRPSPRTAAVAAAALAPCVAVGAVAGPFGVTPRFAADGVADGRLGISPRGAAAAVAAGRVGLGAVLALAPGRAAGTWLGRDGARPAARVLAIGLGARDVTIGVGTAWALGQGFGAGAWLRAGAIADALDCLGQIRARRSLPALSAAAGIAVSAAGALTGVWLARAVE
jgi:hypothetical protein